MVARARLFCEGVLGIFVGMGLDPSAHPAARVFPAVSYFWQGSTERSRPFPTNLRFFASHDPKYSCPPHGSLPHRLRAEPPRRGGQERGRILYAPAEVYPAASGTGGYGIRPYVFKGAEPPSQRRCPAWSCLPLLKARSVGAHSICARGGLPCRKRARADMESAPTFFCRGGEGRVFACCACKRIYFRLRLVKNPLMWYTISLQVHRQTRCKPATQSYRGPSGQPVANKKLLFYCRR